MFRISAAAWFDHQCVYLWPPQRIREVCIHTTHYFDIWHVAWSVTKKVLSASKDKGCEVIKEWSKGICRRLYWSATSTLPKLSSLKLGKQKSFMRHVANKHTDPPDDDYKNCNHGELEPRKWIKMGELLLCNFYYCQLINKDL